METEELPADSSLSWKEEREQLYEISERKIAVIEEIWAFCERQPVPTPYDSPEAIQAEYEAFEQLKRRTLSMLGERPYERFKLSKESGETLQEEAGAEIVDEEDIEGYPLQDSEVSFLNAVERGIEGLWAKRETLHRILRELGENYLNPTAYDSYINRHPYHPPRGGVQKIGIHSFSISLVIESAVVWKELLGKRAVHVAGKHISGSIWNIVYGSREYIRGELLSIAELMSSLFNRDDLKVDDEAVMRVIERNQRHENAHSIIEEFGFKPEYLDYPVESVLSHLRRLNSLNDAKAPEVVIKREREFVGKKITYLFDRYHYEIVTDMVSKSRLSLAYAINLTGEAVREILARAEREGLVIEPTVLNKLKELNLLEVSKRLRRLEARVERRIPEKVKSFYAAVVLFPPSKIRHIERLVDRWIKAAESG